MPPRIKVTKAEIVAAAVEIVRRDGAEALNARAVAEYLCCSTQPVFSNFETMDVLRLAVVNAANALYGEYVKEEMASQKYPPYKATGMAYIRFAREEKSLFKLLYMRDRSAEDVPAETEETKAMAAFVQDNTGVSADRASLFHLEMWAYVHGIATMMATNYLELDTDLVSRMLTDAFQGLKKRYEERG